MEYKDVPPQICVALKMIDVFNAKIFQKSYDGDMPIKHEDRIELSPLEKTVMNNALQQANQYILGEIHTNYIPSEFATKTSEENEKSDEKELVEK